MDQNKTFSSGGDGANGDTWYVDNYILLKEYYDMTISRIAARCVRSGNIAIEEYKHYEYILDVLSEITETGEYILSHKNLFEYVERKMPGGLVALKKNLLEFKKELDHNAPPEMIKEDKNEINKMKEALGAIDKSQDPTAGAGMSMDDVINNLMQQNNIKPNFPQDEESESFVTNTQPQGTPAAPNLSEAPAQTSPSPVQEPQTSSIVDNEVTPEKVNDFAKTPSSQNEPEDI